MLECVVNVSEGWDTPALQAITAAAGAQLLDLHRDEHHNRAVLTLAGAGVETAARRVARAAVDRLDLRTHTGVHPRIGVLDVVPFVPLEPSTIERRHGGTGRIRSLGRRRAGPPLLPVRPGAVAAVRYGAGRSTTSPPTPDRRNRTPLRGASAVGARPPLVAYNLWLRDTDIDTPRSDLAAALRNEHVRALGLDVGDHVQVSMNLLSPMEVGPLAVYDAVTTTGTPIARAELVGLLPGAVLEATPSERWERSWNARRRTDGSDRSRAVQEAREARRGACPGCECVPCRHGRVDGRRFGGTNGATSRTPMRARPCVGSQVEAVDGGSGNRRAAVSTPAPASVGAARLWCSGHGEGREVGLRRPLSLGAPGMPALAHVDDALEHGGGVAPSGRSQFTEMRRRLRIRRR